MRWDLWWIVNTSPASIGAALFQVFFSLAFFVVIVVGPAIAANGIARDRKSVV